MHMLALLSTVVGLGFEPKFHFTVDWASGGVQTTLPIQNFSVRTLRTPFVLTKKKTYHLVLAPILSGQPYTMSGGAYHQWRLEDTF